MRLSPDVRHLMTERELLVNVRGVAALLGWRTYHTHDSRRSEAGFPDLVLVRAGRLLFRELKTETGRPTPEQLKWGEELWAARQDFAIWRPSDWLSGAIERDLQR